MLFVRKAKRKEKLSAAAPCYATAHSRTRYDSS
ncbi:hypothetical protein ANCCAN_08050, partial [Ancylostoma caninum]